MSRIKRFSELAKVPLFAAIDAKLLAEGTGRNPLTENLSRKDRRRVEMQSKKLVEKYNRLIKHLRSSGVKYPIDQLIRQLAVEYNNRYASSGLMTQPVSFNYFEAFCQIRLFEGSFAPYIDILEEVDHLFSVSDFFEFLTSDHAATLKLENLYDLPDSQIHQFTQNGDIRDFTYMTAEGREFLISGFSMVRRADALHWAILGGEIMSEDEWRQLSSLTPAFDLSAVPPLKRRFIRDHILESNAFGQPLSLDGTEMALKTIITGETDLITQKHLGRCYMKEYENSFNIVCDDPDIFYSYDINTRNKAICDMKERIASASVMWNLAEGLLFLPIYFKFRLTIPEDSSSREKPKKPRNVVSGKGEGVQFQYVKSLEFNSATPHIMREYTAPKLSIETEGYWRRIEAGRWGEGRDGRPVQGRTWIKAKNEWRERDDAQATVYIKSTIESARVQIADYIAAVERIKESGNTPHESCVLYVMRCVLMHNEIYKVGWTSGTANNRAKELSAATGVPSAFSVVKYWHHPKADKLEAGVHALLSPYRLNPSREFFEANFSVISDAIEREIERMKLAER